MLKKLFNWLFAKKEDPHSEVNVFDFTRREAGHDITLRMINDGEYAEAVVFLEMGADAPEVGDFIVVDLSDSKSRDDLTVTFVVDTTEPVALGITQLTMSRYEGAENE
ncbi:putative DNA ligase [Salmonella phage 40]|nr:putative DNA ligase [Salmonella phage 40]